MLHGVGTFSIMCSLQPRSLLRDLGDWGYTLNKQNCNNPGYCPACKEISYGILSYVYSVWTIFTPSINKRKACMI